MLTPLRKSLAASFLTVAIGRTHAAPYSITYQGTIADSAIASIPDGQRYTVAPFGGRCFVDEPPQPGNTVNAVPAVGLPALVLLTIGAAALGGQRSSRHRMPKDAVCSATSRSTRRGLHRLACSGARASNLCSEDDVA